MKKSIVTTILLATILSGCQNNAAKQEQLTSQNDSLLTVIAERDAALDEMISTINLVEQGFRSINEAQGRINLNAADSEKSRSETLQKDIELISKTLADNKAEIERLKKQLAKSNSGSQQLKMMLENLQAQLDAKTLEIAAMQKKLADKDIHIEELDKTVEQLNKTNNEQEQTIKQQSDELNTVWYAIGTKRELKDQNILDGGDVLKESDANFDYFTKADMNKLTTIDTHARRAKLLTTHPDGSYTLTRGANKQYTLEITDAKSFWSVSRYLVIQVK